MVRSDLLQRAREEQLRKDAYTLSYCWFETSPDYSTETAKSILNNLYGQKFDIQPKVVLLPLPSAHRVVLFSNWSELNRMKRSSSWKENLLLHCVYTQSTHIYIYNIYTHITRIRGRASIQIKKADTHWHTRSPRFCIITYKFIHKLYTYTYIYGNICLWAKYKRPKQKSFVLRSQHWIILLSNIAWP